MSKMIIGGFIFLVILLSGQQCSLTSDHHEDEHHHLLDKIRAHQHAIDYGTSNDILDTNFLLKVHANLPEVDDFFTETRMQNLTSFPCSNCHNRSLAEMQANRDEQVRKAHWNIKLIHADSSIMNCSTCHSKNDLNQLTSTTGKAISFDESYKLCGQCHSTQLKDWKGGAHGKQLNGWKPPRVAKTCVSCHNPHQPAFPTRFPARLNTINLEE